MASQTTRLAKGVFGHDEAQAAILAVEGDKVFLLAEVETVKKFTRFAVQVVSSKRKGVQKSTDVALAARCYKDTWMGRRLKAGRYVLDKLNWGWGRAKPAELPVKDPPTPEDDDQDTEE